MLNKKGDAVWDQGWWKWLKREDKRPLRFFIITSSSTVACHTSTMMQAEVRLLMKSFYPHPPSISLVRRWISKSASKKNKKNQGSRGTDDLADGQIRVMNSGQVIRHLELYGTPGCFVNEIWNTIGRPQESCNVKMMLKWWTTTLFSQNIQPQLWCWIFYIRNLQTFSFGRKRIKMSQIFNTMP